MCTSPVIFRMFFCLPNTTDRRFIPSVVSSHTTLPSNNNSPAQSDPIFIFLLKCCVVSSNLVTSSSAQWKKLSYTYTLFRIVYTHTREPEHHLHLNGSFGTRKWIQDRLYQAQTSTFPCHQCCSFKAEATFLSVQNERISSKASLSTNDVRSSKVNLAYIYLESRAKGRRDIAKT